MARKAIISILPAFAGISMMLISGCFSYHRTQTEATPAQVVPSEPPGASTTTSTTTQSNNGAVHEHSTTTYNP
jgi:hypothetical protein